MRHLVSLLLLFGCLSAGAQQRFQFSEPKMGSPFRLVFYASDTSVAKALASDAFLLVDSLNRIFSDYLEDSELNRLSRTAGSGRWVSVSAPLYDILLQSKRAAQRSRNTFDITVGPLSKLWRKARRESRFPPPGEVKRLLKSTGIHHLLIDTSIKQVKLLAAHMQLDLGGIAKGYAAQAVVNFLRTKGIASALADAGGDLAFTQAPPGKGGWTVGINLPEAETELLEETIEISNAAVATSGDVYQYLTHNGKRYSHITDPRTGYGVAFRRNVTIVARDGATADWLATACSILPIAECQKLVQQTGAELLIVQWQDGRIVRHMTEGMKNHLRKRNAAFSYVAER